jgi:hypothetical protein
MHGTGGQKMANEKRLIDANAVKDNFCNACSTRKRYKWPIAECRESGPHNKCFKMRLIDEATNIDAVEVVHAKWENVQNGKGCCSNCHRLDNIDNLATHCRYCGAVIQGDI